MSKTLLLVEDDEVLQQQYSRALQEHGWKVAESADGETTLALLRANTSYSVIVLDLRLPDMNGFDVIDRAKEEGLGIPPVIVVSAYVDDEAWRRFFELRIQGLLPKPLDSGKLATLVDAFCEGNETALVNLPSVLSGPLMLYSEALQLYFIDYEEHRGYIYQRRIDSGIAGLRRIARVSKPEPLVDKVKRREAALRNYFTKCAKHGSGPDVEESRDNDPDADPTESSEKARDCPRDKVKRREGALREYFTKRAEQGSGLEGGGNQNNSPDADHPVSVEEARVYPPGSMGNRVDCSPCLSEPLLVVARRWNSWYPSYFNVTGGAYAIIGAKSASGRTPASIIDPGFRAIGVLSSLGVPVGSLNTCVVTHNHPDHVGGIFEYVASRHVLGEDTSVFCSASALNMLDPFRGNRLNVQQLGLTNVDIIPPYDAYGGRRRIVATPVPTSHHDVGGVEGTCGVLLASDMTNSRSVFHTCSTTLVLGDTEYDERAYAPNAALYQKMRDALANRDLKVAVLHIGCSQFKEGTGKHLYLPGLIAILRELDYARRTHVDSEQPLLVLVSEWGLEHATAGQLRKALPPDADSKELISAFGTESLVRETIEIIDKSCPLDRIKLLPADVGLVVGMESGQVYIDGKYKTAPEDVIVDQDDDGLVYKR
jgi:CheY-like chemotaxis protein